MVELTLVLIVAAFAYAAFCMIENMTRANAPE